MVSLHEMQINEAGVHDAGEILALQKAAFSGQARIYNTSDLPPLVQSVESVEQEFTHKTFLKACVHGRIIASVRFWQCGNIVNIERLIVHPAFQNQGIGTHLMRTAEAGFPHGVCLRLFTGEKSSRNIHVYTKLGYKKVRNDTTPQGIVLVHMEKCNIGGIHPEASCAAPRVYHPAGEE